MQPQRSGVRYPIKDGIVSDAKELLADVRRNKEGFEMSPQWPWRYDHPGPGWGHLTASPPASSDRSASQAPMSTTASSIACGLRS